MVRRTLSTLMEAEGEKTRPPGQWALVGFLHEGPDPT